MKYLLAIAAIASLTTAAGAQKGTSAVGTYAIEGTCPGQTGSYRGTLTITKPNALYSLRWLIGSGQVSTAKAIEQDGRLAIAYELDGGGGVMIARPTDTGWEGSWAMFDATTACYGALDPPLIAELRVARRRHDL